MPTRILSIVALLVVAVFCGFGYLASFEPPGWPLARMAYCGVGLLCIAGLAMILTRPGTA